MVVLDFSGNERWSEVPELAQSSSMREKRLTINFALNDKIYLSIKTKKASMTTGFF